MKTLNFIKLYENFDFRYIIMCIYMYMYLHSVFFRIP